MDIYQEFVDVAKRRIVLKAISKGATKRQDTDISVNNFFPGLKQGDVRKIKDETEFSATIFMNPPFNLFEPIKPCSWSSGKLSFAAYALDLIIERSKPGTQFIAILPDVLRSGSRYQRWRDQVGQKTEIHSLQPYGLFSSKVNVDVFILGGTVGRHDRGRFNWYKVNRPAGKSLGESCTIQVGAVVPHRLNGRGKHVPYITAKDIIAGKNDRKFLASN